MLILLFSPAYFWSNTSGRLIFGEINTFPDLQIIVLVPVMRMMTIHVACRVKLEDASALRKNTASPHFLKNVGFFGNQHNGNVAMEAGTLLECICSNIACSVDPLHTPSWNPHSTPRIPTVTNSCTLNMCKSLSCSTLLISSVQEPCLTHPSSTPTLIIQGKL